MIITKLEEKNDFTSSEVIIADYILSHRVETTELSIKSLAARTYTSKSTIIRLCKKLEFLGFSEFQKKLFQELVETQRLASLISEEPVNNLTNNKELIDIVPTIYEKTINDTRLSINYNQINRIANRIRQASKVDFYGMGITNSNAKTAAFKFSTVGILTEAHGGINEHYVIATKNKLNRIAIILSYTGNNQSMISIAKYLKKMGIFIIGIGDTGNGILAKTCHEYIAIYPKKLILGIEVITAITATNYVIDILFLSQLISDYEMHKNNSIEVIKKKIYNDFDTQVSKK